MNVQHKADIALILVTVFWGASVMLTKIGLQGLTEFNLIALRSIIAFATTAAIFHKHVRQVDRNTLKYSALIGLLLTVVFAFMNYGVQYTSASNAGFLTCIAAIFVPMLSFICLKTKIQQKTIFSIFLAIIGVALLTLKESMTFQVGDIYCILCSLFFAVHIVVTGQLTQKVDSLNLGIFQLGFLAIYSTLIAIAIETPQLPSTPSSWGVVLALSLFCSAFGFVTQTVAQKYTSAVHTGLIFSLEPVFAAFFAFMVFKEILTIQGYVGALLLFASLIIVEVDFSW
ncbi:MAG: DMT family transporter [Clostridia bacterium]|nr:DMT family transporter [Clostridia bacterium]